MLSEVAKQVPGKRGGVTVKPIQPGCQSNRKIRRETEGRGGGNRSPPRPKPSEEGRGGGGCSSLRVRWWWWLTMISHGVEISIGGGVEEMVRAKIPSLFSLF